MHLFYFIAFLAIFTGTSPAQAAGAFGWSAPKEEGGSEETPQTTSIDVSTEFKEKISAPPAKPAGFQEPPVIKFEVPTEVKSENIGSPVNNYSGETSIPSSFPSTMSTTMPEGAGTPASGPNAKQSEAWGTIGASPAQPQAYTNPSIPAQPAATPPTEKPLPTPQKVQPIQKLEW